MLFDRFVSHDVTVDGARIHCRVGGAGPPLLLLHGCPQTHVMWHKMTPSLARRFTVVASDLALDRPEALDRAAFLDIRPTAHLYATTDRLFASRYWEWFFFNPGECLSRNVAGRQSRGLPALRTR